MCGLVYSKTVFAKAKVIRWNSVDALHGCAKTVLVPLRVSTLMESFWERIWRLVVLAVVRGSQVGLGTPFLSIRRSR